MKHPVTVFTNHKLDASKRLGKGYTPDERKTIDWSNRSDRKWLESHMHWAVCNHMVITFVPA